MKLLKASILAFFLAMTVFFIIVDSPNDKLFIASKIAALLSIIVCGFLAVIWSNEEHLKRWRQE